jgi:prepilin-type N-terminal cleavage/methylation domain-containing protein
MRITNGAATRRQGLTLMELIIVLMILVALAGILIPILPSMLTRAHVATHTTNVTEISKLILTYQATNNGFPDQWDSMTDGTAQVTYLAGGVLDPTPGSGGPGGQAGGNFTSQVPTAAEVTALNAAGIKSVHNQLTYAVGVTDWAGNAFDPTFANYSAAPNVPTAITTSTPLTYLTPNNKFWPAFQAQNFPSWSPTANYVALGFGPRCTLTKMAVTAPIHFSDTQDATTSFSYGRFVAIFKVSDPAAPGGVNMAQFVGVVAIHATGPNGLDAEFQNWNQLNNGGS